MGGFDDDLAFYDLFVSVFVAWPRRFDGAIVFKHLASEALPLPENPYGVRLVFGAPYSPPPLGVSDEGNTAVFLTGAMGLWTFARGSRRSRAK